MEGRVERVRLIQDATRPGPQKLGHVERFRRDQAVRLPHRPFEREGPVRRIEHVVVAVDDRRTELGERRDGLRADEARLYEERRLRSELLRGGSDGLVEVAHAWPRR